MTPPAAKHPQRCETCKTSPCPVWTTSNLIQVQSGNNPPYGDADWLKVISVAGCASHSSAPDQRIAEAIEKLGELTRCKHMMSDGTCRYDEVCSMCNISDYEGQMYQVRELLALLKAVQ